MACCIAPSHVHGRGILCVGGYKHPGDYNRDIQFLPLTKTEDGNWQNWLIVGPTADFGSRFIQSSFLYNTGGRNSDVILMAYGHRYMYKMLPDLTFETTYTLGSIQYFGQATTVSARYFPGCWRQYLQ